MNHSDEKIMDLERAIKIAVDAHSAVVDKGGNPYILHPLRVMMSLETIPEKIVGILHDVVEDTDWTFEKLSEEGFSEEIINALKSVTKTSENEDYEVFIQRSLTNPIGRKVKIADINDNLDIKRMGKMSEQDLNRINRYKNALDVLTKVKKG